MEPTREFQAGDTPPGAAWWNGLLRYARSRCLASAGAGVELRDGALSRLVSRPIWAKITGSGPGYGFQEATPAAAGGFTLVSGGRSDDGGAQPAYDANGTTGLAGTYQRLRFSAAGDWRFQDIRLGSAATICTAATLTVSVAVVDCPTSCAYTVTLTYGSTTVTLTSPNSGSNYQFTSSGTSGWSSGEPGIITVSGSCILTATQAVTLTCGSSPITVNVTPNTVLVQLHGCMASIGGTVSATQSGATVIPPTTISPGGYQTVPVILPYDGTSWTFTLNSPYFQTLVTEGAYGLNCQNDFFLTPASPLNCCDCNIGTCPTIEISCAIGTCTLTWDYTGGIQGYIGYLTANVPGYPFTGTFPYCTSTANLSCSNAVSPSVTVTFQFIYACFVGGQVGQIFVYYANCGAPPDGIGRKAWEDTIAGHGGNYGYSGYTGAFSGEPVSSPVTISQCSPGMIGTAPPPVDDAVGFGTFTVTEQGCGASYGYGSMTPMSLILAPTYPVEHTPRPRSEKRAKWNAK